MKQTLELIEKELSELINRHGFDTFCNAPDFILAEYVVNCLATFKAAQVKIAANKIKTDSQRDF